MCGRHVGNLLFPLLAAGALVNESAQPRPFNSAQVKPVAVSQAACPNCKTQVLASYDWCPQCGTGLKSHACVYCGNLMKVGERFCPSYGAPNSGK
ncbi:MAG: zinc ribbon domain-containing protein [Chloroflexi bacterium]|nr:zinc ribbon domain-containing protein [Chloroflexota bacterium]